MYHVFDTPYWLGPTGFYDEDLRAPLDQYESKTWDPVCVWATPTYTLDVMYLTFVASTAPAPPSDRRYLLELLNVPSGVTGAPAEGTVWELPLRGQFTLELPTYRTSDGLTGYWFAFTVTEVESDFSPGDFDNDGDVDLDDFDAFELCFTGRYSFTGRYNRLFGSECNAGDVDRDNDIDCDDWLEFRALWTGPPSYPPFFAACDPDCNDNGQADWLDLAEGISTDCQPNGVPDECDIAGGAAKDVFPPWPRGPDGIPDECQARVPMRVR